MESERSDRDLEILIAKAQAKIGSASHWRRAGAPTQHRLLSDAQRHEWTEWTEWVEWIQWVEWVAR